MRFHFGFSFRLKHLKKFLFPFLIGILSYFGFSYFNLLCVNAASNYDTSYNITINEFDTSETFLGDYTLQDILDYSFIESDYYNVNTYIYRYYNSGLGGNIYYIYFYLAPKNDTNLTIDLVGRTYSSQKQFYFTSSNYSTSGWYFSFSNNNTWTIQELEQNLTYLYNCLTSNSNFQSQSLNNSSVYMSFGSGSWSSSLTYNITLPGFDEIGTSNQSRIIPYYNGFNATLSRAKANTNGYQEKKIYINDTFINVGDYIPYYCDLYECNQNDDNITLPVKANYLDDIFISNIPVNDISSFTTNWNYQFLSLDFARSISYQSFFYGRKQELDYYTYIPITCTPVWNTNENYIDENNYILYRKVSSISCTSNLNDYDYIYIRFSPTYDINAGSNLITNITLNTNYGYIDYAPLFNGSHKLAIMDKFLNLSDDFNILLSTNQYSKYAIYKSNHEDFTFMSKVDRNGNNISQLTGFQLWNFGTYDNTNLMVYNYKPQNPNTTDLSLFFGEDVIVSIGVDNVFAYYDSNNALTSGLITNNYQVDTSQYDIDYFFNQINEYLNDIHEDLLNVHNIMTDIYNSIPINIRYFILMFYTIGLLYLVYKVATKE